VAELARIAHAVPRLDGLRRAPAVLADRRSRERNSAKDAYAGCRRLAARDEAGIEPNGILDCGVTRRRQHRKAGEPPGSRTQFESLHYCSSRRLAHGRMPRTDSTFKRAGTTTEQSQEACASASGRRVCSPRRIRREVRRKL